MPSVCSQSTADAVSSTANHSRSVPGSQKNSSSICSNSLVRKVKLPGVISLRKDLPIWPIPNGTLLAGSSLYVLEVYEDTLCSLRTQIYGVLCILGNTLESLEHQVELTDVGEIMLAAARTADVIVIDVLSSSAPGTSRLRSPRCSMSVLCHIVLDELICTETLFTALAVHQRIREAAQMSGCHPCLGVHEDRTVYTYVVRALLNKFLPPCTSLRCSSVLRPDCRNPMYWQGRRKSRNPDIQILLILASATILSIVFSICLVLLIHLSLYPSPPLLSISGRWTNLTIILFFIF